MIQNRIYNIPPEAASNKSNTASVNSVSVQTPSTNPIESSVPPNIPKDAIPSSPSFKAAAPTFALRTELTTKEEKEKYAALVANLDKKQKKNLELLLRNGTLLNNNSNDKSTVLDNLHKILTTQRAPGLDNKVVLKETIATIADPFRITQRFGDIPKEYVDEILKNVKTTSAKDPINEKTIDVRHSGACVAASIEFNLAKQMPAEFARFASELSSPKLAVDKTIKLSNLANNTLDAVWLLNAFEVPYDMKDFDKAKLKLAPDKNAIIRAQIQNSHKDRLERSLVDVLMQSTFMNVGSQQEYDSLTDVRLGKFNENDKGLIEFEKTFTESIVEDKNKISVTYQIVDENAKLTGYETDFKTMKKHITDSLAMGENVIIGYTQVDDSNTIINGHEITIIGAKQDKNGKMTFICNDTDDNNPNPIEYSEDFLVPKIHHAGLPQAVVEKDVKFVDNWTDGVKAYRKAREEQQAKSSQSQTKAA